MWNSLDSDHSELPVVIVVGARSSLAENLATRLADAARIISIPVSMEDSGATTARPVGFSPGAVLESSWDADALAEEFRDASAVLGTDEGCTLAGVLNMNRAPVEQAFSDSNLAQWTAEYEQVLYPVALSCEHLLPLMLEQGHGVMINVVGDLADSPAPGFSAFEAGQAAVMSLSKSLVEPCAAGGVMIKTLVLDSLSPASGQSDAAPVRLSPIHATAFSCSSLEIIHCLLSDSLAEGRSGSRTDVNTNLSTNC